MSSEIKVSGLNLLTDPDDADTIYIIDDSETLTGDKSKKLTLQKLRTIMSPVYRIVGTQSLNTSIAQTQPRLLGFSDDSNSGAINSEFIFHSVSGGGIHAGDQVLVLPPGKLYRVKFSLPKGLSSEEAILVELLTRDYSTTNTNAAYDSVDVWEATGVRSLDSDNMVPLTTIVDLRNETTLEKQIAIRITNERSANNIIDIKRGLVEVMEFPY